jgi:hypothetical protein
VMPRSDSAGLPVRPGEEPWTGAELEHLRAKLVAEAAGLRAGLARAASEAAERLTEAVRDAGDDQADAGRRRSSGSTSSPSTRMPGTCSISRSARWPVSMREYMEYANRAASR